MIATAAFLGDGFGHSIAALGLALSGLLGLFYFGRIASPTATARNLPGWMGLLLFVPVLIFFVYPHFAFHDGWIGPHKVGLTIGSVLLLSTMAPAFRLAHAMGETGNLSPKLLLAMNSPGFSKIREAADLPYELSIESTEPHSNGSIAKTPIIRPELIKREEETIRSLYSLESQLDSLDLLAPATRRSTVPPP